MVEIALTAGFLFIMLAALAVLSERLTASETKSLDVVVSVPAQMTNEPVAPTASPGTQGTPPAEVSD